MNNFDLMIEKYRRELIEARKHSMFHEMSEVEKKQRQNPQNIPNENASVKNADNRYTENGKVTDLTLPRIIEEDDDEKNKTQDEIEQEIILQNEENKENEKLSADEKQPTDEATREILAQAFTDTEEETADNSSPSSGELKVQVFAADRVYPIAAAHVVITGGDPIKVFFDGYTDTSGITEDVVLPAPARSVSDEPSFVKPYSQYDILIEHPGYISQKRLFVPVFSGIESIQNVQLIPAINGEEGTFDITQPPRDDLILRYDSKEVKNG